MNKKTFYKKVCAGTIGLIGVSVVGLSVNAETSNVLVNKNIAISQNVDQNNFDLMDMDVNLGDNVNGADGVGVAFHQGAIGDIGANGGGLGIRGLKKGIGFELDTYSKAQIEMMRILLSTMLKWLVLMEDLFQQMPTADF